MEKRYWYITPEDYEVAAKNGIKRDTVNERVRRWGWDVDRAITTIPKRHNVPKELMEKAKAIGLEPNTVATRLYRGWTMEEACSRPKKQGRQRLYPDWVYEKAKENNIRYSVVNHRVHDGWDLERACTERVWTRKEIVEKAKECKKRN